MAWLFLGDLMNEVKAFQAERQRRRDAGFLMTLWLLLMTSAYAVVWSAYSTRRGHVTSAGEIRAVDPATLRRQLRSGRLSNKDAVFWRRVGEPRKPAGGAL